LIGGFQSLRYRFTLVVLAAVLTLTAGLPFIAHVEVLHSLENHTLQASRSLLAAWSRPVADLVLVEDRLTLRDQVLRMERLNAHWLALAVLDAEGRVLVHAPDQPPEGLDPTRLLVDPPGTRLEVRGATAELIASDLVVPSIGSIRVAVDLGPDATSAREAAIDMAWAILALGMVGLVAAGFMGHWLMTPLVEMTEHARRVGRGELGEAVPVPEIDDEVAVLARALNSMTADLRQARDSLLRQQQAMVRVERMAALGAFAAGAAHEVANPLGGVAGCVRRLARPELSPERRERYGKLATEGLERATRVLKDMLIFARADPRDSTRAGLTDLAWKTVEMVSTSYQVRFVVHPGEEAIVVWPLSQVNQVLTNLLLNAAQAATETVEVGWLVESDSVIIDVIDDGPGIPAEIRDRVFEPFFTTREPGEGTGLGLSVSLAVVQALGGTLELDSMHDRPGTRARLRLPRVIMAEVDHAS